MIRHDSKGFTLIELLLALAFVTFILLFAVTATISVMRSYNKGLVIKEINQTARYVTDDISRVVRYVDADKINTTAVSAGRLCLGGVSYVWNVAGANTNKYSNSETVTLARVNDSGGAMCKSSGGYPSPNIDDSTQLVSGRVWIHNISISPIGSSTASVLVRMSTADDPSNPALISHPTQGVACKGGDGGEFCAVANFTTTVILKEG